MSPIAVARIVRGFVWSAAAALFGLLIVSLASVEQLPAFIPWPLLVLAVLAASRPAVGLMIVALTVPVAWWVGSTWYGAVAWPEVVAVAFLVGYAARQAFDRPREGSDPFALAIHATIVIVAASVGVQLLVLHGTIGAEEFRGRLLQLVTAEYFVGQGGVDGVDAGMRLIEGLLLAHAGASVVRNDPAFGRRIVVAVVIGAAAASALNVWRIWLGALRLDSPVAAFLQYLVTLRFNAHYRDINAAGSYFLMALLPALALMRARSVWRWLLPALLIAVSLLLSGSRAAILAGVVTSGAIGLFRYREARHSPVGMRSAAVITLVVAILFAGFSHLALQRNLTPATIALRVRAEYTRISFQMLATRPVFGIGTGQYPGRLSDFATPTLMALYPVPRENAHNYFLQILAELGITGFAAFIGVLGIAGARMLRLLRSEAVTILERSACAGLFAFVLTWLSGHPLLVDAPTFSFWLFFGAVTGYGTGLGSSGRVAERVPNGARVRAGWTRWSAAGLMIALIASIPVRAQRELGEANLEHLGIGVSQWQPEKDGVEYRLARAHSIVFVPSYASVVEIPLRAAGTETSLRVEIRFDGRPADAVTVRKDAWHTLVLQVPRRGDAPRFRALELRVIDQSAAPQTDLLMIGKVRPRGG